MTGIPMQRPGLDMGAAMGIIGEALNYGRSKYGLGGQSQTAIPVADEEEEQQPTMGYSEGGPVEDEEGESYDPYAEGPVQFSEPATGATSYTQADPGMSDGAPVQEAAIPEDPMAVEEEEPLEEGMPVRQSRAPAARPQAPMEAGMSDGVMQYLQGADATPAQTASAMEHSTGEQDPIKAKYAALMDAYEQGGPEQAWRLMQSYRQQDMLQRTLAATQLQRGDIAGAAKSASEAMNNVLDGKAVQFQPTPDGRAIAATVSDLSDEFGPGAAGSSILIPLQNFYKWLTGAEGQHDALLSSDVRQSLGSIGGAGGEVARDARQAAAPQQAPVEGGWARRLDAAISPWGPSKLDNNRQYIDIQAAAARADEAISPWGSPNKSDAAPMTGRVGGASGEVARDRERFGNRYEPERPPYVPPPLGEDPYQASLFDRDQETKAENERRKQVAADRREQQRQRMLPAEARYFGEDAVRTANSLFPYEHQAGARAKFLQSQYDNNQKYASAERVAQANAGGKLDVANAQGQNKLAVTDKIVGQRHDSAVIRANSQAEVARIRAMAAQAQHLNTDDASIVRALVANDPSLAKKPEKLAEQMQIFRNALPPQYTPQSVASPQQRPAAPQQQAAPQRSAPQQAPQQQQAPQRIYFQGNSRQPAGFYIRGPNGEAILDPNQ